MLHETIWNLVYCPFKPNLKSIKSHNEKTTLGPVPEVLDTDPGKAG